MELRLQTCDRAVQLVSLELDGELSTLERAILRRHLQRCERCAVYARRMTSTTHMLRSAPQEQFRVPVGVWRPRHRVARAFQGAAAAAAVALVSIWLGLGSSGSAPRPSVPVAHVHTTGIRGSDDRFNWSAGLPRTVPSVQLFPGGLYTSDLAS